MGKKATPRRLTDQQALATNNMMRGSPRKLNILAAMIRGMTVGKALEALTFNRRRLAGEVKKVVMSAIANAENNHDLDIDQLVIQEATVGKALVMKRFRPRAKGRAGPIHKPFSKLRVVVEQKEESA